ncbi:MAG: succinate dehydrogenase cytochrome b subunit [Propionibacteriaceae bacterium]|jgi:succinate dehydrogenase / fumarate reductase cytochrome b subunit|nr:succinate dehydrogenase cytochrome b subunit [Propionibacteriaceae bacterium]
MSVQQKAVRSTVVKKAIMALTGLVLVGFLLMHMFGNLKVFAGPAEYNHYALWLKQDLLYPILPHGWFIWLFRIFLILCVVLHLYCALRLTQASLRGRGTPYVRRKRKEQTFSVRWLRWFGLLLIALISFHILMFTTGTFTPGFEYQFEDPYSMYVGAFQVWWVFAAYGVFMLLVCFHLRHGFWSAFTTLGANVGPSSRLTLNLLAYFFAALLFVGFLLPATAVFLGWVI